MKRTSIGPASILGATYVFEFIDKDKMELEEAYGYIDFVSHTIYIDNSINNDTVYKRVVRHEILHAFLYESGLHNSYCWDEETTIDWFAIQSPKIYKIYEELGVI